MIKQHNGYALEYFPKKHRADRGDRHEEIFVEYLSFTNIFRGGNEYGIPDEEVSYGKAAISENGNERTLYQLGEYDPDGKEQSGKRYQSPLLAIALRPFLVGSAFFFDYLHLFKVVCRVDHPT